jgi:inhibitor of cysteine peptidase
MTALVGAWLVHSASAVPHAQAAEAAKAMMSLTETDNGRTIDVRLGDTVRITLRENATTGYRWAIDRLDADLIEATGSEPHYVENKIGVGGTVDFTFKGKKAGTAAVVLKNWRHWEGDSSVTSRFRVTLHVQP